MKKFFRDYFSTLKLAWGFLTVREKTLFVIGMVIYLIHIAVLYAIPVVFGLVVDSLLMKYVHLYVALQASDVALGAAVFVLFTDLMYRGRMRMVASYIERYLVNLSHSAKSSGEVVDSAFSSGLKCSVAVWTYFGFAFMRVSIAFLVMLFVLWKAPLIGIGALLSGAISLFVMRHTSRMGDISNSVRKKRAYAEGLARDILIGREDILLLGTNRYVKWFSSGLYDFTESMLVFARVRLLSALENKMGMVMGRALMFVGMVLLPRPGMALMFYWLSQTATSALISMAEDIDYFANIVGGCRMLMEVEDNASS